MSAKKSGLRCYVYRDSLGDCSNGGISSKVREVTLLDVDGPFGPTDDAPAVRLVRRVIFGQPYVHAEPVDQPAGMAGPMFGGTFIHACDSRFRKANPYPIPLHDRFE